MSKTWYPIIDYDKCTGCLACYDKCSHGVYELNSRNFPKVVAPEGCVHGCTGCGSLCPQEAIAYMGAVSEAESKGCDCDDDSDKGCGCGSDENAGGGCCGDDDTNKDGCGCGKDEVQEKQKGCGCGCC